MKMEINGVSPIQFCVVLLIIEVAIFFTGFVRGTHWASKRIYEVLDEATEEINKEQETLEILENIIKAESGGKHEGVWGDEGKSYGIVQFSKNTFEFLSEKSGIENLEWKNEYDQIVLLRWAIMNDFGSHWSTYEKAKKGGD